MFDGPVRQSLPSTFNGLFGPSDSGPPLPVGTVVASDDFVRANTGDLNFALMSDGVHAWRRSVGPPVIGSLDNHTTTAAIGTPGNYHCATIVPSILDSVTHAKITTVDTTNILGVVARKAGLSDYYFATIEGGAVNVGRVLASVRTILATGPAVGPVLTLADLALSVVGSELMAFLDGVFQCGATDATIVTNTGTANGILLGTNVSWHTAEFRVESLD